MSDIETRLVQLERTNRRWKTLAICACGCVCFFAAATFVRVRSEWAEHAVAERMHAEAEAAAIKLQRVKAEQP